jgi:hypothetical protein
MALAVKIDGRVQSALAEHNGLAAASATAQLADDNSLLLLCCCCCCQGYMNWNAVRHVPGGFCRCLRSADAYWSSWLMFM